MLAAVYWARAPRVVLPDRALCLPTFCHSLLTVNKSSSSSSSLALALNGGSLRGNTLSVTMSDGQAGSSVFELAFTVQSARLVYTLRIRKLES